jgi:hypothetical protein
VLDWILCVHFLCTSYEYSQHSGMDAGKVNVIGSVESTNVYTTFISMNFYITFNLFKCSEHGILGVWFYGFIQEFLVQENEPDPL